MSSLWTCLGMWNCGWVFVSGEGAEWWVTGCLCLWIGSFCLWIGVSVWGKSGTEGDWVFVPIMDWMFVTMDWRFVTVDWEFCVWRFGVRVKFFQLDLRPGALLFNAGFKEQVFSPKPWKKIWRRSVLSFTKKTQIRTFKSVNDVTEPKARLLLITSYKLLTGYKSVYNFRKPWFPKAWNWLYPVNSFLTGN